MEQEFIGMLRLNSQQAEAYLNKQKELYNRKVLDDLNAGAGIFGFNKPKTIRDLAYHRWIKRLNLKPGEKVLDVGCNAGAMLEQLRREFDIDGYGIDISKKTIEVGKEHFPNLTLMTANADKLPFVENYFDALVSFEMLEHATDHEKVIKEFARVLKPSGRILIYTITSRNFLTYHWMQYHLSGGKYGTGAYRDHIPELLVKPKDFAGWAQINHLKMVDLKMFHSFFTLMHDEPWTNLLSMISQIIKKDGASVPQKSTDTNKALKPAKKFIIYRIWLIFFGTILQLLDSPWKAFKFGDGFFALLKKY